MSDDQIRLLVLNLTLNAALLFGLVLVFVLLLVNALLAERQSRQKLAIANEQLQQYALRIEDQTKLQERNRIARKIHDSVGHSLTAQSIQLENALMFLQSNRDKAQAFLKEAPRLGTDALREVRQSIATLRFAAEIQELKELLREVSGKLSRIENRVKRVLPVTAQKPSPTDAQKPSQQSQELTVFSTEQALQFYDELVKQVRNGDVESVRHKLLSLSLVELRFLGREVGASLGKKNSSPKNLVEAIINRTNVRVSPEESGLPMETVFLCFQIRSLDSKRFPTEVVGQLSDEKMRQGAVAVRYCLGL